MNTIALGDIVEVSNDWDYLAGLKESSFLGEIGIVTFICKELEVLWFVKNDTPYLVYFDGIDILVRNNTYSNFLDLKYRWEEDTRYSSNPCSNKYYDLIVNLGVPVIPFIFRELLIEPDHWFIALNKILKINPIKLENRGNIDKMTIDWLEFGDGVYTNLKQCSDLDADLDNLEGNLP